MASPETGDAFLQKAISPEFDGIDATRLAATDRCQSLPARQIQDDPSSSHIIGSAALTTAHPFQLTSLRRTQSKERRWHEENHTPIPSDVTVTVHLSGLTVSSQEES